MPQLGNPKSVKGGVHFAILGFVAGSLALLAVQLFGAYLPANVTGQKI